MFARKTTAIALGSLIALAVTLTSAIAPAYAATPAPLDQSARASDTSTSPQFQSRLEDLSIVFQPDVRVKYLGPAYNNGKYLFRFKIENVGAASASNVFVDREVRQVTYDGSVGTVQSVGGQTIPSLASGQSVEVKVSCTPLPGYVCMGASADAQVPDDLDPSNNKASST